LADETSKTLTKLEKELGKFDGAAFKQESGIINYIREAAKYTSRGGCEKSGQYVNYQQFMQGKGK
jgi:hypothetical protein